MAVHSVNVLFMAENMHRQTIWQQVHSLEETKKELHGGEGA